MADSRRTPPSSFAPDETFDPLISLPKGARQIRIQAVGMATFDVFATWATAALSGDLLSER
jgi:hypothetical protein